MVLYSTQMQCPSFLARIKEGMQLAYMGLGDQMNGHNVMRIDYREKEGYTAWGHNSRNVTKEMFKALTYA